MEGSEPKKKKEFFPNEETAPSNDCFYSYVTSQIQHHNDKIDESFKYYLTVATFLFGALGWYLARNEKIQEIPNLLITGMVLIALLSSTLIFINARAKHGYRNLEAALTGRLKNKPKLIASHLSEIAMWGSIFIISICYIYLTLKAC